MLLEALEHGLTLLYSLSRDSQHHNICYVWHPACWLLTAFLTLCIYVLYCLTISPLVLKAGSKTPGCLSHLAAAQEAHEITAFFWWHPLAFPAHTTSAELRTCSPPPQVLPAHTAVHVVTRRLSLKEENLCTVPPFSPLPWLPIAVFHYALLRHFLQQARKSSKKAGNLLQCWHIIHGYSKSWLLHLWYKIYIPPSYNSHIGEITSVYCELSTSATTEQSEPIFVRWSITCLTYSFFSFKLTWKID